MCHPDKLLFIDSRKAELAVEPGSLGPKSVWKWTDWFARSPSNCKAHSAGFCSDPCPVAEMAI